MTGYGATTYTDPDDYRVNVPGLAIELVLTRCEAFKTRVTWVSMRHIAVALIEETAPHIAFLSLAPGHTFLLFPLHGEPVWNGVRARRGNIVVKADGAHIHQHADGATRWGLISIRSKDLATYGRSLLGKRLPPLEWMQFPSSRAVGEMLRLHGQICRVAASRQDVMALREVGRAAEQDLIHALVNALSTAEPGARSNVMERRAEIMVRFEKILAGESALPALPALSSALGVPQRTLRLCCEEFLGRSPLAYARLRRLNRARWALSRADCETESVASIARSYGFLQPGRFAVAYRTLFGETPSATLQRKAAESA
jgi:AraC-like DNA-binding protein